MTVQYEQVFNIVGVIARRKRHSRLLSITHVNVAKIGHVLFPYGYLGASHDRVILAEQTSSALVCLRYRNSTCDEFMKFELGQKSQKKSFYLTAAR